MKKYILVTGYVFYNSEFQTMMSYAFDYVQEDISVL